ncbi:class I SAM-dependent methyltransferase [Novipirellula artificiosorum]|uniref:Ubiquinone biosynthesis O-methyltransferase n=1 Tax=Novipirellula artificiosorum TaxID=2528016 RepID=A0A5C6DA50_9BACT|nr:class I SAM-dependent methyltransferase [Novipirellula artificiosorum]TWU32587.1 Ubiquinone biosynthesis O-methyltransferase [Novipirellula artificiosorum]
MSLQRTLEPESMDTMEEAILYVEMNHAEVNRLFAEDLFAGGPVGPRVIDLGCGPALIAIEIASRDGELQVMGIDSAVEMLDMGKRQVDMAGLLGQVFLQHADLKQMGDFEDGMADTVVCNSVLHHLPQPRVGLETALRLVKPGGRVFIRDLYRPETEQEVERLVELHGTGEPEAARQLLRQSLHASLTLGEAKALAESAGISPDAIQMTSDRHWTLDWKEGS